ncbi:MAG TPA: cation:dicarboxylase symporter family transporter [Candidatus Dormibacteraeota bacterium]|jgi:proton glutamate symport protein|nr:cation:dicarboxylase symporter family transporter [Candidatus Dormibacteraeota bacterium]
MEKNAPENQTDKGTTRVTPGVQIAGLALLVAGFVLIHFAPGHIAAACVRWAGLILLGFAGIRKQSLSYWIFFAMLAGLEVGLDWPGFAVRLKILSDIFLRLIKVIVAPLILGTLITGVAGHGDIRKVGRIGWKSLLYFEVITTIALVLGVLAINLTHAGEGLVFSAGTTEATPQNVAQLKWDDFVLHIFPENIVKAIAENQILQVAVFAILFAIALSRITEKYRAPMLNLAESLTQTMFSFTNMVMYYAPVGVGAAMAYTVGHMGTSVLLPLAKLLFTAYGALIGFLLIVLLPVALFARVPLRRFLGAVAEPATIAFATSTSEAALPRAMECMEVFGVPRRIVAFVIPAGYSFNLDGSTLYLAVSSIFVAQAAGMHMSWREQVFMVFALMLTSKGIAGVPRATLVVLLATSSMFHLPTEPIFVILGVDALIDMARTSVNVIGNCLASAVVARWEGELTQPEIAE